LSAIAAGTAPTSVRTGKLTDGGVSPSGLNDIVVANNISAGQITVVRNLSTRGDIASAVGAGATPIVITSPNHGLLTGDRVVIFGVQGFAAANGVFTVGAVTTNTFELAGT